MYLYDVYLRKLYKSDALLVNIIVLINHFLEYINKITSQITGIHISMLPMNEP